MSPYKTKHSVAVAEYMKQNAIEYNLDENEMFTLGLIHDIGYLLCDFKNREARSQHNKLGGDFMKQQGYKYWTEIFFHGSYPCEYESPALTLLNEADMQISPDGTFLGYEKRLEDIRNRYGSDSREYKNSYSIVQHILIQNS